MWNEIVIFVGNCSSQQRIQRISSKCSSENGQIPKSNSNLAREQREGEEKGWVEEWENENAKIDGRGRCGLSAVVGWQKGQKIGFPVGPGLIWYI